MYQTEAHVPNRKYSSSDAWRGQAGRPASGHRLAVQPPAARRKAAQKSPRSWIQPVRYASSDAGSRPAAAALPRKKRPSMWSPHFSQSLSICPASSNSYSSTFPISHCKTTPGQQGPSNSVVQGLPVCTCRRLQGRAASGRLQPAHPLPEPRCACSVLLQRRENSVCTTSNLS